MAIDRCRERTYNRFHKGGGAHVELIRISASAVILLLAVRSDFSDGIIRNRLIAVGILIGILCWIPGFEPKIAGEVIGGLLLPILICWIPFRMHGLGAGDIKLFCVIGCLNGSRNVIYCICISFLLAAGFSFGRLLNRKQFRTSMRSCIQYFQRIAALGKIVSYDGRKVPGHQIHFSAFILLGYAAVLGVNLCKFIPL